MGADQLPAGGRVQAPQAPRLAQNGICFVSNFNKIYMQPVFEALGREPDLDVEYYFYSNGGEKYWLTEHGVVAGERQVYLRGFSLFGTRIALGLFPVLARKRHDLYVKCANGRFALPVTYLMARMRRRPFVLWTEIWTRYTTPGQRLGWPLARHIYRNADAIVATGEHVKAFLTGHGVSAERIVVFPFSVDNDMYSRAVEESEKAVLRRGLGISEDAPVVLYLGRLSQEKGVDILIEAFATYLHSSSDEETVLVVAGTGSEEPRLKEKARTLGIEDRTRWPGYVKAAETVGYYAISTTMVLPSVELPDYRETWGLTVNEAMNQGVPVIVSDTVGAGAGGLVLDGKTGLIVPQRNPDALAHAIKRLLGEADLHMRLSAASRDRVLGWTQAGGAKAFAKAIRMAMSQSGRA